MWIHRRFEVKSAKGVQHATAVEIWGASGLRPILCYQDAGLRPATMRVFVGPISRRRRRQRLFAKRCCKVPHALSDQRGLPRSAEEPLLLWKFGVPVFVPDPRHAPMNIGSFG